MSTFKDITYKKHDDETWAEWTKRVPDNDQDKRNYISDTIYVKIYENDEEKAGKITGMLLNLDVEELIVLLESNDLLEDKIKEEYQVLRELEEYKDILYKKNDDETWAEWTKRVPDNDEDKLDYIGETIYAKIYDENKEKAGKITGMLLEMDIVYLLPLLERDELLDEKIKEAYQVLREDEEIKMNDEEVLSSEVEYLEAIRENHEQMRIDMENHRVGWAERCCEIVPCVFCSKDTAKVKRDCGFDICNDCFEVKKTSDGGCLLPLSHQVCWPRGEGCDEPELVDEEEKCEQCGKSEEKCITEGMMFDTGCLSIYAVDNRLLCPDCIPSFDEEDDDDYKRPVVTLTVAEMIEALSKLPPDAKLVMTESGFYSTSDFAEVMLPRPYKVENDKWDCNLPTGTQVYIIGHSHQSY